MVKYKVALKGDDGLVYYANLEWLKQILGVCSLERKVKDAETIINTSVDILLKKHIKEQIVELLRNQDVPRTLGYIRRRIDAFQFQALHELQVEKKIAPVRHGTQTCYKVI